MSSNYASEIANVILDPVSETPMESDNQMQNDVIKDTMSYSLYNAVRAENGDVQSFLGVLRQECDQTGLDCSTILYQATPTGDSLLHVAAEFGKTEIAKWLVDHHLLLDTRNIRSQTPLHIAAKAQNIEVMRVILSKFEDDSKDDFMMSKDTFGNTALHEAILRKDAVGVDFLLSEQSESSQPRYWGTSPTKSPMYLAVQIMDMGILRSLLRIPLPFHRLISGYQEISPVFAAISERNDELLREIVDKREDLLYLVGENQNTPLHHAASTGYMEGVRILLEKPTLIEFRPNSDNDLPIHVACKKGHIDVVKELLQGKWHNTRFWLNKKGRNILHIAARSGQNDVVKYLLRDGNIPEETLNERDLNGETPLHLAATKFCLWCLFLLSRHKKVKVNILNNDGLTARDIIQKQSTIARTTQHYLANAILESVEDPSKENLLRVKDRGLVQGEWNAVKASSTLIIVATLITSVTFAAGFTVPGGVYSTDHPVPKEIGMVVLADRTLFKIFMVFNTIALFNSILGSVMILWVDLGDHRFAEKAYRLAKRFVQLALSTMPVAFLAAIRLVVSNNTLLADFITVVGAIFSFFIIIIGNFGRIPLGTRRPIFRQVGDLFIRIVLRLFYGKKDKIGEKPNETSSG